MQMTLRHPEIPSLIVTVEVPWWRVKEARRTGVATHKEMLPLYREINNSFDGPIGVETPQTNQDHYL